MKFQDISTGGHWFYRCRDKGTRMLNNLVTVTSLWKIWKRIYWILSLYLNLPAEAWESLEMPTPYKLQVCFGTIPWCTTGDQTHASISVHNILWKKQEVRFWGIWKGCTDLPLMVVWHSRENMEEEIRVHWSPMFPHTVLRNHISVLMVFNKDCEYPYWDGFQPRVFISSFVRKSMPSRSLLILFPGMQRRWIYIFTLF